jgi:FKBP-type peptidyl-prolyl cis-trans isomerase
MTRYSIAFLLVGVLLASCGKNKNTETVDQNDSQAAASEPTTSKFTPFVVDSSKMRLVAPGVKVYTVKEGTGNIPNAGDKIIAHYHGMLPNGKVFDSSFERGQPFEFPLGQGRVIQGWDKAFATMKVGTQAVLVLSPDMAYGVNGTGPIPPNATLIFHVELLGANKP